MATVKQFNVDGTLVDIRDSRTLVTGVKGSAESTYRTGNVNLSKTNVGLENVPNVTTNNQTPTFSQASTRDNLVSGDKLSVLFSKIMKWFADLKTVAFTGAYADLSGLPTIPTVNNATLTIQKNGTNVQTFTANSSSNKTANITVPTKTSELTNDSGFITNAGVTGVKGNSESTYRTGNVNITKSNIGLGSVGNFKAVSTVASQGLSDTEKANARANIGAGTSSFSGSYTDLTNKPTIPTVNNATLTIQKNGTTVKTFTANASSNVTANITVPTKTSQLTNDSSFINENILNITSSTVVATLSDSQTYTVPATGYYRLYGKIPPVYDTNSHQIGFLLNDIYCVYYFLGDVPEFFQFEIPLILKKGTVIKFACDVSGSTGTINKLF